ncbi:M56 family metallopeptidase [Pedobacter sp. 22163]|uniref:M56 family metallopeptidase n=1 Tax=Pedobacter sp. 22163 TaxID=3453883 RepID=UPI003F851638
MEWLTYLLKVTACTVLFFGFYLLVLRKLTFFKINRFYLLATLLLSFIIPALQFEVKREITIVETEVPVNIPEIKPIAQAPVQPVMVKYQPEVAPKIDWVAVMYYVYGCTASLILLVCLWRLFSLLKHTNRYTKNGDGLKLITKTEGFTNCSFFNYVFINDEDLSTADLSVLLKHEQVHARQYHSIDKIVLMVFKAVLWFNPVVYLYDKALEQIHEYEADEISSTDFGNQEYANLLLKLAISKSDVPLIHNFVKSPIKDRIKMLFKQKSGNMKKLVYVLALPILLGLVYGFTVEYVDVSRTVQTDIKTLQTDSILGKSIEGVVIEFNKKDNRKTFSLKTATGIYSIEYNNANNKLKIGDKVIALISANILPPVPIGEPDRFKDVDITYLPKTIKDLKGNLIYEFKPEKHAFLYEANKARFASSKIKSIQKGANGKIEKIVLNDGFFIISLNLKTQNIKDDNFKVGDKVLVKFIGEKLVSKNTYSTDKMIVLYSEPKKYTIKNEALYNRFYFNDGKQKVAAVRDDPAKISEPVKPKIISFSKITGDTKNKISYMENAVIDISNCRLEARYVELDQANNKMIAKNASLKNSKQNVMVKSNLMKFDLKKGDYRIDIGDETKTGNNLEKLINSIAHRGYIDNSEVDYNASDSITISKDKSIISLFGNAKVFYNKTVLSGTKIVYNKKNSSVTVNNATMMSSDNKTVKADSIYFDLKTTKAILYSADFKR